MKIKLPQKSMDEVLRRLRRIEGQARGIQKMVFEARPGEEILQQMNAMNAAIQGASIAYLRGAITVQLATLDVHNQSSVDEIVNLVEKLP